MAYLTPMAGPVIVDQPAVGNIRYGLYTAANGPFDLPTHGAIGGVQYQQEHCGQGHLLAAASCGTPTVGIGTLDGCDATAVGLPFEVVATLKAGAFPYDATEVERRLRIRLADNEQYVAEQAFWGGTADVQPVLQRTELNGNTNTSNPGILDVTPTPGTPVTLEYGVARLEDALAQYSYPGIIHARPLVAPYAAERSLAPIPVRAARGAVLPPQLTPMGNVWSFGRGYSGNKPTDDSVAPSAGTAYLVATGVVSVWREPDVHINPPERSFDRSGNAWQATGWRSMAITIDCVAFFVLVGLDAMTTSTGPGTAGRLY